MSATCNALLRTDLRDFGGYKSARSEALAGEIWLNANEAAWPNLADAQGALRRYPEPQPQLLCQQLSKLYAVDPAQLLVGRGSDEGIDLLLRAFCEPGRGAIVITPPVFGMYAVCAKLHGARCIEVPLRDGDAGLCVDLQALGDAALAGGASLVFLCSPGNPSATSSTLDAIAALAMRLREHALLVVDEAYIEYAETASAATLLSMHENLVVLRTLSKAHALAAARVGCVLADASVIVALRRCQAPYPLPQPVLTAALAALQPAALAATSEGIAWTRVLRERLWEGLRALPCVRRVYPSSANFLLVRFVDAAAAFSALLALGVVVRDVRAMPQLDDALRISVGTEEQCRQVLAALSALQMEAVA